MIRILTMRSASFGFKQLRHSSSPSQAAIPIGTSNLCSSPTTEDKVKQEGEKSVKQKNRLVEAAFEKLKTVGDPGPIDDAISKKISEAKDVNGLLSIVTEKKITRHHALKLVSVLGEWTVEGRAQTEDFEKDPRFVTVCHVLGTVGQQDKVQKQYADADLSTVLGVTTDDEAAKHISNITLSQMIKVMSTLASKKRRSTVLLRTLAYNIAGSSESLDIKQGADALYALASLNYHDEVLADKICDDLCKCVMGNTKRAVVGSIITSLGLLRHKHPDLLDLLSEWVVAHADVCSPNDLSSLLMTLAMVHHLPANQDALFPVVVKQLEGGGIPNPQDWLDVVWALTVMQRQSADHVASVLSAEFMDRTRTVTGELPVPTKLKLLNINGVAKLRMKDYNGPLLDLTSEEWNFPLLRSKEKQTLVAAVQETMLNLLPSAIYLGTNVDTSMGFMIDAECSMSASFMPLPLFDKKTKAPIERSMPGIKVAILVWDYHDMTRGRRDPTGVNVLSRELVQLKGYRIMIVDYMDFNPRSKLVNRVQYLNQQLKAAIGKS